MLWECVCKPKAAECEGDWIGDDGICDNPFGCKFQKRITNHQRYKNYNDFFTKEKQTEGETL